MAPKKNDKEPKGRKLSKAQVSALRKAGLWDDDEGEDGGSVMIVKGKGAVKAIEDFLSGKSPRAKADDGDDDDDDEDDDDEDDDEPGSTHRYWS